jgi:hypothetical protein
VKKLSHILCLLGFASLGASCTMTNLHTRPLKTAVVDHTYNDSFFVENNSWGNWGLSTVLTVTGGALPNGIILSSNGQLSGTPTQVGDYGFRVTSYTFDNDYFSDDDVYEDSEWFGLFVTEASTNSLCPDPSDVTVTEIFVCLGDIETETWAANEDVTLDVNYFVDFDNGNDYDIFTLDFSIFYDDTLFAPDANKLNSQILREAATRTDATVSFTQVSSDELRVVIQATSKNLHKAGRILDLPFQALANIPAGEYGFTVVWNGVTSHANGSLPSLAEVDGVITVTN